MGCLAPGKCKCDGWTGENCEAPLCEGKTTEAGGCSGHGLCIARDSCKCKKHWKGYRCENPQCGGKTTWEGACSGHGKCKAVDQCECDPKWSGQNCETEQS